MGFGVFRAPLIYATKPFDTHRVFVSTDNARWHQSHNAVLAARQSVLRSSSFAVFRFFFTICAGDQIERSI
jgi:hypothetical protein